MGFLDTQNSLLRQALQTEVLAVVAQRLRQGSQHVECLTQGQTAQSRWPVIKAGCLHATPTLPRSYSFPSGAKATVVEFDLMTPENFTFFFLLFFIMYCDVATTCDD